MATGENYMPLDGCVLAQVVFESSPMSKAEPFTMVRGSRSKCHTSD
jgi:hypothetical protein